MKCVFLNMLGEVIFRKDYDRKTIKDEAIWDGDKFWFSDESKKSKQGCWRLVKDESAASKDKEEKK